MDREPNCENARSTDFVLLGLFSCVFVQFLCVFMHFCRAFLYIAKMRFHHQSMRFHKTAIYNPMFEWAYTFPGRTRLSIPNCISIGSAVFAQFWADRLYNMFCNAINA